MILAGRNRHSLLLLLLLLLLMLMLMLLMLLMLDLPALPLWRRWQTLPIAFWIWDCQCVELVQH